MVINLRRECVGNNTTYAAKKIIQYRFLLTGATYIKKPHKIEQASKYKMVALSRNSTVQSTKFVVKAAYLIIAITSTNLRELLFIDWSRLICFRPEDSNFKQNEP